MPDTVSKNKKVEVKTTGGSFLFGYEVESHVLEVHRKGLTYRIPIADLIEFGRTAQKTVLRVQPIYQPVTDGDEVVRQGFE